MTDEDRPKGFDEVLRSIAAEVERAVDQVAKADLGDLERLSRMAGLNVDVEDVRRRVQEAGDWVREQVGDVATGSATPPAPTSARPAGSPVDPREDPVPSTLDLPTGSQGTALAALDSGRWVVEPGSRTLSEPGAAVQPAHADGLYGDLRVRDWLSLDGVLTTAGQSALRRWFAAAEAAAATPPASES